MSTTPLIITGVPAHPLSLILNHNPTLRSPSPSKHRPQYLRSCLSPNRSSSIPPRSPPSRADSFSSDTDTSFSSEWRTAKSVRWEGEDIGCAVTSYFSTYSAAEYDRTPLEPPSEAERTCVLPARGSRCLRTTPLDIYPTSPTDTPLCESPIQNRDMCSDALAMLTSQDQDDGEERTTEDDEREWEECMDRRRMMFAMRQSGVQETGGVGMGCPEFEGYRSISKSLAEMLRSVGVRCGDATRPIIEEGDGEMEGGSKEGLYERLRSGSGSGSEEGERRDGLDTPSLISSEGSEVDCCTLGNPDVVVVRAEEVVRGSKMLEREVRLEVDDD